MLEQDIAASNIALDLIGQSRNLYQYAALLKGEGTTEDTLAYLRGADEFRNLLIAELPNGDWANTVLRVFFFSTYQYYLFQELTASADEQLAAIAEKSIKEVTYHVKWSSEWVIRLGDGTEESHQRTEKAINELLDYTHEMFILSEFEEELLRDNIAVNISEIENKWNERVRDVFTEATLSLPAYHHQRSGGKEGKHSEALVSLLNEMQELQRNYPGCEW